MTNTSVRAERRHPAVEAKISPQSYTYMQQYIYENSGIVLDGDKHYLLESRLLPLVQQLNLETLDDLCRHLRAEKGSHLIQEIVDAMTTNETLFFRDNTVFEALRSQIIPAILEQRRFRRKLRIWSAASSSGQEAYSLAMMLQDMNIPSSEVEILGTDISTKMLNRARSGRYIQFEISRGLPAHALARHFVRDGPDWRVKKSIREMVRFEPFDLRGDMTELGLFDLVLCRNVLIYFDRKTKDAIFSSIRKVLQPGGVLMLGSSESVHMPHEHYERRLAGPVSYYYAAYR